MKRKKYNQTGVWACPYCWKAASKEAVENMYDEAQRLKVKKIEPTFYCCGTVGLKWIYFDSQAEYVYGQKLKEMESKGLIFNLIHHPRIELSPNIFFLKLSERYTPIADQKIAKKYPDSCIKVYDKLTYEADFQYTDAGGVHSVEIKNLSAKTRTPFIPNLPKFRRKVELLKAIHGIEVEIWTGNIRWHFVGKKLEVIK